MSIHDEILAVKKLGEEIGFGNMMSLASALWAVSLEDNYSITTGNFIPVMVSDIRHDLKKQYETELNHNKKEIREQL